MLIQVTSYGENVETILSELPSFSLTSLRVEQTDQAIHGTSNLDMTNVHIILEFVGTGAATAIVTSTTESLAKAASKEIREFFAGLRKAQRRHAAVDAVEVEGLPPFEMTLLSRQERDKRLAEAERSAVAKASEEAEPN